MTLNSSQTHIGLDTWWAAATPNIAFVPVSTELCDKASGYQESATSGGEQSPATLVSVVHDPISLNQCYRSGNANESMAAAATTGAVHEFDINHGAVLADTRRLLIIRIEAKALWPW